LTKIIADSGSTKTDWLISTDNQELIINTTGINPVFMSSTDISEIFENLLPNLDLNDNIIVHFYGASCSSDDRKKIVYDGITKCIPNAEINIDHDLIGAARAACSNKEGIACILGTGSNSCYFNGNEIEHSIGGHGFILGDEGSGADIGKRLLQLFMENELDIKHINSIKNDYQLDRNTIIDKVYRSEKPNQFLASLAQFVQQNEDLHFISEASIEAFIKKHILKYRNNAKVNFVGSIAFHFQDILKRLLSKYNLECGNIFQKPIEGLKKYHLG
jgi:N-acetylglucosamine kinase-like BadF-type ATPase